MGEQEWETEQLLTYTREHWQLQRNSQPDKSLVQCRDIIHCVSSDIEGCKTVREIVAIMIHNFLHSLVSLDFLITLVTFIE